MVLIERQKAERPLHGSGRRVAIRLLDAGSLVRRGAGGGGVGVGVRVGVHGASPWLMGWLSELLLKLSVDRRTVNRNVRKVHISCYGLSPLRYLWTECKVKSAEMARFQVWWSELGDRP